MNISFAWTTEAFLDGSKRQTRRFWKDCYARRFRAGQVCGALDKDFRAGGKVIGHLMLIRDPYRQPLSAMTEQDFVLEGGERYWLSRDAYIEAMGGPDRVPWVVEFVKVQVCRVCGCHDYNCSGCIARTGAPCHWIEPDLCSACAERERERERERGGEDSLGVHRPGLPGQTAVSKRVRTGWRDRN